MQGHHDLKYPKQNVQGHSLRKLWKQDRNNQDNKLVNIVTSERGQATAVDNELLNSPCILGNPYFFNPQTIYSPTKTMDVDPGNDI